jgi:polysaccharide export outer membrane protein
MVFFDREKTTLSSEAISTLDSVLAATRETPSGSIRVIGHSGLTEGGLASKIDPVTLSIKRAESVRDYLMGQNVPAHRIRVSGVGKGLPLVPKDSKEGAKNRRVEVIIAALSSAGATSGGVVSRHPVVIENQVFTEVSGVPEYIIGPGDILDVTLWRGLSPEKFEATVRPNGRISFGFIEDTKVADLTLSEIDNLFTEQMSKFVKQPRIDVLVKEYHSKSASIFGGISKVGIFGDQRTGPGTYILKGKTTLLDLIIRAGGTADNAKLERVEVIRRGGRKVMVNLARAIFEGDASQNLVVDNGDVVFVPLRADNRVFVVGEVNRQGSFIVDERVTVLQAISLAGGFTIDANERKVFVFRGAGSKTRVIIADLKNIMATGDRTFDILVAHNDVIVVPISAIGKWNRWMDHLSPTLRNIEDITGILLDIDAMTPGSGTGDRGPLFRD